MCALCRVTKKDSLYHVVEERRNRLVDWRLKGISLNRSNRRKGKRFVTRTKYIVNINKVLFEVRRRRLRIPVDDASFVFFGRITSLTIRTERNFEFGSTFHKDFMRSKFKS